MLLKRKKHKNIYVNQWLISKTENVQKTKFQIHSTHLKVTLFKMMKTLLSCFNDFYCKGEVWWGVGAFNEIMNVWFSKISNNLDLFPILKINSLKSWKINQHNRRIKRLTNQ